MTPPVTHQENYAPQGTESTLAALGRVRNLAIPLGGIGIVGLVIGFFMDRHAFFTSYMWGYFFWMSLTLGATTITYLHHVVRARWSLSILRIVEAANKTLPYMAALFLPILFGMFAHEIYQWSDPAFVAHDEVSRHRQIWLNPVGFTFRAIFYFAFWIGTTSWLNASSLRQDRTGDGNLAIARGNVSAPVGVFHVLFLTLAITDWLMSLDPHWYSTIYGVIYMMSGFLGMLALSIAMLTSLGNRKPFSEILTPGLTRDLGNMLLGITMFWTYTTLSQFLIIWSANLPEEITFYVNRFTGGLVLVGAFIVAGGFFAPFLALLSGRTKRTFPILRSVAIWVVLMRVVDSWWQITPFFRKGLGIADLGAYALDLGAWAAIGGVWVAVFIFNLRTNDLLARHDLRLIEAKAEASHA